MVTNLLIIETDYFDVIWKGPRPEKVLQVLPSLQAGNVAKTVIRGNYNYLAIYHSELGELGPEVKHPPLFFEQQNYELIVETKKAGHLSVWHENPLLRSAVRPVDRYGKVYSAIINFGSEVGNSEFVFLWNGRQVLTVDIETFPSKIDYRLDYEQMLQEVHTGVLGLVFNVLTKTYRAVSFRKSGPAPTGVEWMAILRYLIRDLEVAVQTVARHPHHALVQAERMCRLDQVRRPARTARNWLLRHPEQWQVINSKVPQPVYGGKIPATHKQITYDTPENRFVRWVLEQILKRLRYLGTKYRQQAHCSSQQEVSAFFLECETRIKRLLQLNFLKNVKNEHFKYNITLVLQFGAGYREVLRSYLLLLRGLNIRGEVLRVGLKSIHELYEYWCFLRLREILNHYCQLRSQDIISVQGNGITLKLKKGSDSRIIFQSPDGAFIELGYNAYPDVHSPTTPQRPDMLLTLDRKTPGGRHRYIMDAKYRIDTSSEYIRRYGAPGPREEDINVMHRYRDAFLAGDSVRQVYSRDVLGACILFPWRGDFIQHHFYHSLSKVGIGALPFLPGATGLVEQFLRRLLEWPNTAHMDRAILPRDHEVFWGRRYRNNPVLVGTLGRKKRRERLEFARRAGYYHIPVDKFSATRLGFEYVAFFVDGCVECFAQTGETTVVRERDLPGITELRPIHGAGDRLYYKINLLPESWQSLDPPITNPLKRRFDFIGTTLEALLTARTIDELRLKHETERRLLEALRAYGIAFEVIALDDGRWELLLAGKKTTVRPQISADGLEIWIAGATSPHRVPGSIVRQRPEYVVELLEG
ncbi:DUF2357 domain-containing protein [Desulfurispora thermophila]|uniref:DUF2357 domain-containing protein n=1 Tax=Desulfurispora thermophila TaxID=265470 RepID=UPI00036D795E|nr:DUF2357 domain-containing protein [Desulfurispora thermophila]